MDTRKNIWSVVRELSNDFNINYEELLVKIIVERLYENVKGDMINEY